MPQESGRANYEILRQAIHFDTQKRFEILREEIEHFISSVEFRTGKSNGNGKSSAEPIKPSSPAPNSQSAFLLRLASSANQLKSECDVDLNEIGEFEASWQEAHRHIKAAPRTERSLEALDRQECFAIVWNSKLHEKAIVIAERLGDLHDRLEQFLQRTNPDHPDPTLRRRSEQGLTDKYLCEFTRWVHRDIALFAESTGANYPYGEVPSTYQSWAYDRTSRQHAFMTLDAHIAWKRPAQTGDPKDHIKKPQKFTAVSLSYWIPERPALVPIIGHELAHQVFRDLYGRELNFPTLENDESEIARVVRRLTSAVEAWLSPRFRSGQTEPKISSYLVQEVMCDCLAAVRFGYGYAYAWILETISDERFAQLFHDEYGMLRRFAGAKSESTGARPKDDPVGSSIATDLPRLQSEVMLSAKRLQLGTFNQYYRGIVLAKLLEQLGLETDSFAQGFQLAFEKFLSLMLQIYTLEDPQRAAYEDEMARDMASKLVDEWLTDDGSDGYGNSDFVKRARSFWETRTGTHAMASPALRHQQLNSSYRRLVADTLSKLSVEHKMSCIAGLAEITDPKSVRSLTDLTWRLEWLVESVKAAVSQGQVEDRSVDELRGALRALSFIGMDDYLVRTANPIRLFSVLVDREDQHAAHILTEASGNTNTLDADVLENVYGERPLRELDDAMKRDRRNVRVKVSGHPIALDSTLLSWIEWPLLDPDLWQHLISGPPGSQPHVAGQYILELLKVRGSDGALGRNMNIQQRRPMLPHLHSKYEAIFSASLLGRYDAVVLHRQVHKNGQIGWDVADDKVEKQEPRQVSTVSRAKRLVRIHGTEKAMSFDRSLPLVAVVLVSLKWDASRPLVARWLGSSGVLNTSKVIRVDAFLSDGWEDLVLLASSVDQINGGSAQEGQQQHGGSCTEALVGLIQRLNSNPFVASTETLFTRRFLQIAPSTFQFRFAFRVAEQGYTSAKEILMKICTPYGLDLQEVAGNKDFELIVPSGRNAIVEELHGKFHLHADSNYRVETRAAWTVRDATMR